MGRRAEMNRGEGGEGEDKVMKNIGGVAYQPQFLLDAVLLCDNLKEPSVLRDTLTRRCFMFKGV